MHKGSLCRRLYLNGQAQARMAEGANNILAKKIVVSGIGNFAQGWHLTISRMTAITPWHLLAAG